MFVFYIYWHFSLLLFCFFYSTYFINVILYVIWEWFIEVYNDICLANKHINCDYIFEHL